MISDEILIGGCIIYIIGVGFCSYYLSTYKKKINCFGKKKEKDDGWEVTVFF